MVNSAFDAHAWESEEFHVLRHSQGNFLPSAPIFPVVPKDTHGAVTCVPIVLGDVHYFQWAGLPKSLNSRHACTDEETLISIQRRWD